MSDIQLLSKYEFNMGGGMVTLGFTDDNQIYSKILMIKKTAPLDSVSSVIVKKGLMTAKIQYDIKINKNGKEQIFQIVQLDSADEQGIRFVNELKSKIPATCQWVDKIEDKAPDVKDQGATRTYNLQVMWFVSGKTLAGMGWGLQMFMSYGMLTICTLGLTLPLTIYAFAAGCHRVTTNETGIRIRKLGSKFFTWDEVDRIEVGKYEIIVTKYGAEMDHAFLLKFKLISGGKTGSEFIIRSLEGKTFVKEMIERKKISAEAASMFL